MDAPGRRHHLLEAGATEVIQPELEAAQTLIRHGLERLGIPHEQVKAYMEERRVVALAAGGPPALPPRHRLETKTVRVGRGSCADSSLRRARVRERTGVSVIAVRRGDGTEVTSPGPDLVLRRGDEVTVIGLPEQIALFERLNEDGE